MVVAARGDLDLDRDGAVSVFPPDGSADRAVGSGSRPGDDRAPALQVARLEGVRAEQDLV